MCVEGSNRNEVQMIHRVTLFIVSYTLHYYLHAFSVFIYQLEVKQLTLCNYCDE